MGDTLSRDGLDCYVSGMCGLPEHGEQNEPVSKYEQEDQEKKIIA